MKKTILTVVLLYSVSFLLSQVSEPEMVYVEGGTYKMGIDESKYFDEYPDHTVSLNNFLIGKFEVSIDEYEGFCRSSGLEMPLGEPNIPATKVSWQEAIMYCNWLSRLHRLEKCYKITRDDKKNIFTVEFNTSANGYRLPTEAEWEYAARGGINQQNFAYSGSNIAAEVAWFMESGRMLNPVGRKKANELGIYDMTGNCQEWCFDIYLQDFYKTGPTDNPVCEKGATDRVSRGGNFNGHEGTLRISKRFYNAADFKDETIGFRLAKNQ